jgi:hypothetical protein
MARAAAAAIATNRSEERFVRLVVAMVAIGMIVGVILA